MNTFLQILLKSLALVPYVVAGVEKIHTEVKNGAEKKQIAQDALATASGLSTTFLNPEDQPKAAAITSLISSTIDNTVAAFNQTGVFTPSAK